MCVVCSWQVSNGNTPLDKSLVPWWSFREWRVVRWYTFRAMTIHHWILWLHLLGAAVWTGGHLILTAVILPQALRARSVDVVRDFESRYERIGIPALAIQVVTGLWLASQFVSPSLWLQWDSPLSRAVLFKLRSVAGVDGNAGR